MRIAQIAPICERVPAEKYGGTERVVYELTEELVKRGHDVTLFATGDSKTSANLSAIIPKSLRELNLKNPYGLNEWSFLHFGLAYAQADEFDIIHDHNYAISIPTANLSKTPVLATMHGSFHESNIPLYSTFANVYIVTISYAQIPKNIRMNLTGTVYNGLTMDQYPFGKHHDGYLLYVGRMSPEKGVHLAIEAALRAHIPLIIAARIAEHEKEYFNEFVKPHLSNPLITLVGEVDEAERNILMSRALAFLHPVQWPEPFGLTIIESMACGTPVIAFNKGSIPELIQEGKTGYVVKSLDEMVQTIQNIEKIDRSYCRKYSLGNFNAQKMADGYEAIYHKIIFERNRNFEKNRHKKIHPYKKLYDDFVSPLFPSFVLSSKILSLNKSK